MAILSPWKKDFPALNTCDNNSLQTIYLDSAATCQVPYDVIIAVTDYLHSGQGNAGRGMHGLSENATNIISQCRQNVSNYITCQPEQVIFTKGATESINLVAASFRDKITSEHSILVTELEHHSNLLPWQRLCQQTGAKLNVLPIDNSGNLIISQLEEYLSENCVLFAMTHSSNVLGNHLAVKELSEKAKQYQVKTLIDGAQALSHMQLNMQELDCDYYAFSGHKLYAPGGSGVLYSKDYLTLEPLLLGGGIVNKTTLENYQLQDSPSKLEAGSANLVALVGLAKAIEYIQSIGLAKIIEHEQALVQYLSEGIQHKTEFQIISHPSSHSLVSLIHPNIHCHDVASLLSEKGIAVRAGHHCAQPCLNSIGVKHCVRVSLGLYNDSNDIDQLIEALLEIENTLG